MTTSITHDMEALARAFEEFNRTTQSMEESYRRLEERMRELDQELAEKNRALALTSDRLNSVLECMSDGVIAIDTAGIVTTFNRAASQITGFAREDVEGRPFREVFGRDFFAPPGRRAMDMGTAADGIRVPVSERDSPLHDRDGRRTGTVKVFQDLTEIEALKEQVRQKDRLAALGEMAATVAHEIRNPLGGVRGFAALLAREIPDEDPKGRLIEKVLVGVKDLETVVNELLEYTRPLELRLRATPCAELVDVAAGYVNGDGRDVVIENRVDPALKVLADPDKMRQVFLNILLNAAQAMDGAGTIAISADCEGDHATLAFADTGCGIDPARLDRIFTPFFTTKEKGTGLGLALARKIIDGHGGRIAADSTPGAGATFTVRLALADG
jgi:PAS domain S-box-containing protein